MSTSTGGIHVSPGEGIVAHLGSFVAFATGDDDGLNQLIVRLNALADAEWPEIVRTLTSDIAAAGYDTHPAVACAAIEDARVRTLVFGDLELHVQTDSEEHTLNGAESSTWVDVAVRGAVERIRCGNQSASAVVGVLRDGVVPGGGFLLDTSAPIPAATRWEGPELSVVTDDDVAADGDQPIVDLDAIEDEPALGEREFASLHAIVNDPDDEPETIDAEVIDEADDGVEDFDDPEVTPLVTGLFRSRVDRNAEAEVEDVTPPEPPEPSEPAHAASEAEPASAATAVDTSPIGLLTFDDGASLHMVRPVVVGRGVPERYLIDDELATTVLLDDTQGLISNVHLEIRVKPEGIELLDKDSTHGSFVFYPDRDERVRLNANEPMVIGDGATVELGQRSFTFTIPD